MCLGPCVPEFALRFGPRRAQLHPQLADRGGRGKGRGKGREGAVAPLLESRDPHLAGGEKTTNGNFQVINSQ